MKCSQLYASFKINDEHMKHLETRRSIMTSKYIPKFTTINNNVFTLLNVNFFMRISFKIK